MFVYIFLAILFLVFGLLIHVVKAYDLIAGYNTMDEETKKHIDIKKIARVIGLIFYFNSVMFTILGAMHFYGNEIGLRLIFPIIIGSVVLIFVLTRKYENIPLETKERLKTSNKVGKMITVFMVIIAFGIVSTTSYFGLKSPDYHISDTGLEVDSFLYGETINWEKVEEVLLLTEEPIVLRKVSGFSMGSMRKGVFEVENFGDTKLFTDSDIDLYVVIVTDYRSVILNNETYDETLSLYELIRTKLDQ